MLGISKELAGEAGRGGRQADASEEKRQASDERDPGGIRDRRHPALPTQVGAVDGRDRPQVDPPLHLFVGRILPGRYPDRVDHVPRADEPATAKLGGRNKAGNLITFGIAWLGVAIGMVAKGIGSASNLLLPLIPLPFFGSGFVPTASMPDPVRLFADNQPFTPMIEAVRGLLLGTPVGNSAQIAVAWSVAFSVVGYLWAMKLYNRDPAH